jgi:hypothetical protein
MKKLPKIKIGKDALRLLLKRKFRQYFELQAEKTF